MSHDHTERISANIHVHPDKRRAAHMGIGEIAIMNGAPGIRRLV